MSQDHDEDVAQLLELHEKYLRANDSGDVEALRPLWSDDPRNVFFNLSGHNYHGLEHWCALWDYYRPRIKATIPWTPFDTVVRVVGDAAWITCSRYVQLEWIGEGESPFSDTDLFLSRSTLIYQRGPDGWQVMHAHFSHASTEPRPGGV